MPNSRVDSPESVANAFLVEGDSLERHGFKEPPTIGDKEEIERFLASVAKDAANLTVVEE